LSRVNELYLDHNHLTKIEPMVLQELRNLHVLRLDHNQITEIKPGVFHGLLFLTRLELGYNQLTEIKDDAFSGLLQLMVLHLEHNQLVKLQAQAFNRVNVQLSELHLNNNKLEDVGGAFGGMPKLGTLDLHDNCLTSIPQWVDHTMKNLTSLDLRNNLISEIPQHILDDLTIRLEVLDVEGNPIVE